MYNFKLVLFLIILIQIFIYWKIREFKFKNKGYLKLLSIFAVILFGLSFVDSVIDKSITLLFDIFIVFHVVFYTFSYIDSVKDIFSETEEKVCYIYALVTWIVEGFSIILAITESI